QLRRHHQRLRLAQVEARREAHRLATQIPFALSLSKGPRSEQGPICGEQCFDKLSTNGLRAVRIA
ncbi:hypothetical protein, partial [Pseudomonas sp. JAI120]|uniref:hypothetical protein n=1 Tax=Pseudomonas sp. JAI120 TaxID=2723063 RepID=UPI0030EE6FF6